MTTTAIVARNLRVWRGDTAVLDGVDLRLMRGEALAILGASGAGKSTLLYALVGALGPRATVRAETLTILGRALEPSRVDLGPLRGAQVGLLPQDAAASLDPLWSVGRALREILQVLGVARAARATRAAALLAEVGLDARHDRARPHALSGGEQQRAALAMALAGDPALLLLDEPTSALDGDRARDLAALLRRIRAHRGMALLVVSHDHAFAASVCERVVTLVDGRLPPQPSASERSHEA